MVEKDLLAKESLTRASESHGGEKAAGPLAKRSP